jgi:hypothetical protein
MTYPYAAGHPDYSSTGNYQFIPQIWSGKMQVKYYDYTVLSQITNTDYEGEIKKQGDTVIIRTIPSITVSDYHIGQKLVYERPSQASLTMTIDKGKSWAIELDDVVKSQTDIPLLNKFTDDAAMQLKLAIESAFFEDSAIYSGMTATENTGATAGRKSAGYDIGTSASVYVEVSPSNILDYLIDCGSVLDEQNVPETGRWFVIPTWMAGMIKKSDLKDASLTGDGVSPLRNGRLGMIDRFTLYSSNLLYVSTATWALFGTKDAISFATQLTETESLRSPDTFGDRVRGLQSYGYKVVQPKAFGALICKKAS